MIDSLHIAGFKLFQVLTLPRLGRMNLFVGGNNTGKSCVLEAISIYAGNDPIADILQVASLRSPDPLQPWSADGSNIEGTSLRHPVFDLFHRGSVSAGSPVSPIVIRRTVDPNALHITSQRYDLIPDDQGVPRYVPAIEGQVTYGHSELALPVTRGIRRVALVTRRQLPLRPRMLDSQGPLVDNVLRVSLLPASGLSDEKAASLWDQLIQGPGQERVLDWMRLLDPRIQDLDYIAGAGTSRTALLKIEDQGRIPLGSIGDGVRRIFQIALAAVTASKGVLLIDEFENGLHWRVQRELWAALGKAAKEFEVQVFATTHSRDCIGGFVSASQELGIEDAKLYRLEREDDEIFAVDLALINVEAALRLNGEFR